MGKLIRDGYKFTLELGKCVMITPTGHYVELIHGDDDIIVLPHSVRPLPNKPVNLVQNTIDAMTPQLIHDPFLHASADRIHKTLNVTTCPRHFDGRRSG